MNLKNIIIIICVILTSFVIFNLINRSSDIGEKKTQISKITEISEEQIPTKQGTLDSSDDKQKLKLAEEALLQTRLDEAKDIYESILKTNPNDQEAKYGLASVFVASAEYIKSVEALHDITVVNSDIIDLAISDKKFDKLKDKTPFHDLLKIYDKEIPEMYPTAE